ncbi:MAG: hypothetical protein V1886_02135 [archaeon]
MKKFGICLDYRKNIWKTFYDSLSNAKNNSGKKEEIYQIDLMPAEAVHLSLPHMLVSSSKNLRHLEDIFISYESAADFYNKNNLNISIADIMPVWKIFKVSKADNRREKVYEAPL